MSIRRDFPDLPPVWWASTLSAQALAAWALPGLDFTHWLVPYVAALVGAAGVAVAVWAAVWFWRRRTTIEPRDTPTRLIVEGPFRLSRNPIYLGMELTLIAAGLWFANGASLLLALPFRFIILKRFVEGEEAVLREAFGEEADAYIARTRRW